MRVRRAGVAAALLLAGAGVAPSTAAPAQLRCDTVAVSPTWVRDRTGLCAAVVDAGTVLPGRPPRLEVAVHRTVDGGRTWQRRAGRGLVPQPAACLGTADTPAICRLPSYVSRVVFSANYSHDHRIYLVLSHTGLLVTTDGGDTFVPVDPRVESWCCSPTVLEPYLDPTLTTTDEQPAAPLAYSFPGTGCGAEPWEVYNAGATARLDPPLHRDVFVAPMITDAFLFPDRPLADGPGFATGFSCDDDPLGADRRHFLYACTFALSCPRLVHTFPVGNLVAGPFLGPGYDERHPVLFAARRAWTTHLGPQIPLVSYDGGRGFVRWKSVERLLPDPYRNMELSVATGPQRGLVYLWLRDRQDGPGPEYRVYRSTDGGETWRQTFAARGHGERGAGPAAPWADEEDDEYGITSQPRRFQLLPDGRLFYLAGSQGDHAHSSGSPRVRTPRLFCSVDGGRTWASPCAR